jgi:methyl-accepting chemotaxis protein
MLEKPTKHRLEDIVEYIKRVEEKERKKGEGTKSSAEVSTHQLATKQNISEMYDSLCKQLDRIVHTTNATLYSAEQTVVKVTTLKEVTYEVLKKIGKVNEATDKIVNTTQLY